ncbi:MAG: hypothetical protein KJZ90_15000, partial [Rhodocyclaceae bacterium]|nr:hypothetical protein [Rhodocyclaceae bacterium]
NGFAQDTVLPMNRVRGAAMGVVIVAAQQRDTITDTELCGQSEHLYQLILIKRKFSPCGTAGEGFRLWAED